MTMSNTKKAAIGITVAGGLVVAGQDLLVALKLVEKQELVVYADKLAYGIPTVCSGFTDKRLQVGKAYTQEDCDKIDSATAEKYGMAVIRCIKTKINQNQLDSFTLFYINVGEFGGCDSRATQLMNDGKYLEACRAMAYAPLGSKINDACRKSSKCMKLAYTEGPPVWSYAGGNYVQGLNNRRLFEKALCEKPVAPPPAQAEATA